MDEPAGNDLEVALKAVRGRDIPLGERLGYLASKIRELDPDFYKAADVFVGRLEQAGAGQQAPQIGDEMPEFVLPDDQGQLVSLSRLLVQAPVVVVFHRGHWCPYCRLNAAGLAEVEGRIKPVQIVAISAETQAYCREIKAESGAGFPFLSDLGNGYALSLNLAILVDEAMASLIAASGRDVPKYQGEEGWILPIPAVFVVGQDGLIKARHVDPDYRQRMELEDLIAAAKAALS
jgi:peroxiredoxin